MTILYDATPLLMRSAGVKNYHHALLRRLIPTLSPHSLRLFPHLKSLTANRNESSNYPGLATALRLGGVLASNYLNVPLMEWAAKGVDLCHVTPHWWNLPRGVCLTSMVHDPTPMTMPECHTESNIRYFKRYVEDALPRLRGIIVPSQAVKEELVNGFKVKEETISVIYHGVDEDYFEEITPAVLEVARTTYGLPKNYILFVGSMEPRKNLERLVIAFRSLREELQREYPLVIVGSRGWKSQQIRKTLAQTPRVHVLGHVRRKLMPAVYSCASLFVFPSLHEGFGLPLLEAMAARVPVVASNRGAIPEVVGDNALLVDPWSTEKLASAMAQVLENLTEMAKLADAARQQARQFTWEKTAAATKAFFEASLGRQGS